MVAKTISELTAAGTLGGTELFVITDGDGNSRKVTLDELKTFINTDPTVVPSSVPYSGARVVRTSDVGISGVLVVAWQSEERDTDSFWSAGAPTRLTVPTGVTKVKVSASARLTGSGVLLQAAFLKNGAASAGLGTQSGTVQDIFVGSDVLDVVAGDYFEVQLFTGSGATVEATTSGIARTWFAMEVIEA